MPMNRNLMLDSFDIRHKHCQEEQEPLMDSAAPKLQAAICGQHVRLLTMTTTIS
jgi:hypothetical protein